MATAIPELIAIVLQTRLQQIKIANGFETTVTVVERPAPTSDMKPQDNQIVISNGNLARRKEMDCGGNPPAYAYQQSYSINAVLRPSETSSTASATLQNRLTADMVKAITAGVAWWQMDGNAIMSEWEEIAPYEDSQGSAAGVRFELAVTFRCDANNPYNPRG
tara:strand:- start:12186 stop:12674 length:489 start_codon:yes stop_codon:yes gene_type:complete